MQKENFNNRFGEKSEKGSFLPAPSVNRLRMLRTAGLFMLFICLLLCFAFGFGFRRSDKNTLTAHAADDWGAVWNTAIDASSSANPQTVKLTSAWNASTGTRTGSGFHQYRIYVPAGKSIVLNLNGQTINRGLTSANNYGSVFYVCGTLTLRGSGYIRGGYINGSYSSAYGGGIHIASGGVVNLEGPTIGPNKSSAANTAAGVYVAGGGTLNMKSGYIGNSSYVNSATNSNAAGGVFVANSGIFNMTGGAIYNNTASGTKSGAGVRVVNGGTFNMSGGYICRNTASGTYSGAGVYLDGVMKMTGGQIGSYSTQSSSYYNSATNSTGAGGVYYAANGDLSVGGSGSIYFNIVAGSYTKDIVFAQETSKIKLVATVTSSSYKYGIYKTGAGSFTAACGTYCSYPTSVFVVQNSGTYSRTTLVDNGIKEVAQLNKTNMSENWTYFVKKSVDTKTQQTVTLTANWTASGGSFGTDTATFSSGRIYVPAGADIVLNLNGYTVNRGLTSTNNYGSVIYVAGTLTVKGTDSSYIKGGFTNAYYSTARGGGISVVGGTLNMQGGVIGSNRLTSYNTSYGGGAGIYVSGGGTVNMTGGYIGASSYANTASSGYYNAGGVCVGDGGTFNLSGGNIFYNTASYTSNGGAVSVWANGTFNMTGGYIRYNTASNTNSAGGVYLRSSATASFTGGYIANGTSYANKGSSTGSVGGVYVSDGAKVNLGGSIRITGNTGAIAANMYFASPTGTATVVSAFSSAKVGVVRNGNADNYAVSGTKRNFTADYSKYNTASPASFFTADALAGGLATHEIYLADNEASLKCLVGSANWSYAVARSLSDKSTQTVTLVSAWNGVSGSLGSGTGFSQGRAYVPANTNIVLNLNGFTVNRGLTSTNNYGSVFTVDGTLTVKGNSSSFISGGYTNNYSSSSYGAGITISGGGVLNLEGGVIAKNTATATYSAGGVYVASGATFNMKGGYVGSNSSNYNTATNANSAGGVFVAAGGTFNMAGGVSTPFIYYNRANGATSGAGVYVAGSTSEFNMTTGYIRFNTASGATSGGGVYLNGAMTMTGGQIGYYNSTGYGNTASNTSTGAGGVYYAGGSLSIGGDASIYNNTSGSSYGKDIIFAKETLKINFESALKSTSYRFGIYKTGVGAFTTNFGKFNTEGYYSTFFVNYNSSYTLGRETIDSVVEVALVSTGGAENWSHAVQRSLETKEQQTVTLTRDWNASSYSFGTGTGYDSGRLYVPAGADIVLRMGSYSINRGITSASTSNYGSVFYICGKLTIEGNNSSNFIRGGFANGSSSTARGGGAHIDNGGVLNLKSGIFAGNRSSASSYSAGGVYVANGGTFNMSGGYVGYNTSTGSNVTLWNYNYSYGQYGGGGVVVMSGGTFNMTGGNIYSNYAGGATSGGGVMLRSGAVMSMGGGTTCYIGSSNSAPATGSAGGVYVSDGATLKLGGGACYINGNTGAIAPNLYFASPTGYAEVVGTLSGTIGVKRMGDADNYAVNPAQRNITKNYSDYHTSLRCFRADDSTYHVVQLRDGEVVLHCKRSSANWSYAVARSLADKSTQTVTLEENWTGVSGSLAGEYSTGFSQGRIFLPAGASIILNLRNTSTSTTYDYTINRGLTSVNNYGSVMYIAGTLVINGSTSTYIQGGYTNGYYSSTYGGGIHIASGGSVTMNSGILGKNKTTHSYAGAGVYVGSGAIFNLAGGFVGYSGYANSATNTYSAGGVYVTDGGVFNMTKGSVYYNTASGANSAGGVYVASGGTFNMSDGYIRNNTASGATGGGGVYLAGVMKMTGGRIGNINSASLANNVTQATSAGGLYYASSGNLSVGGNVAIANNTISGSTTNAKDILFASEKSKINVISAFTDNTSGSSYYRFGIYKSGVGAFTSGYGTYASNPSYYSNGTFRSQNSLYTLGNVKVNNVTEVSFTSIDGKENWAEAVKQSLANNGAQQTVKLTRNWVAASGSFGTGTGYYSSGGIYVPSGANIVLNLNGYSVDRGLTSATNYGSVFYVEGTLTIEGGGTSGVIKGGYANGNVSYARGGGVHVYSGGVFNFKSGIIGSNKSNCSYGGSGVHVGSGGTFNMSGGYIGGYNSSLANYSYGQYSGAGVYVTSGATFNMTGGNIRYNVSSGTRSGAGIYASGIVKISNGQIGNYSSSSYANRANGTESAGGIYVANSGNLSFGGGYVSVYYNTGTLAPNVYFVNSTAKAGITGTFSSSSYKIGVKRAGYADNYATNNNRNFTNGWSSFNGSYNPVSFFVCDDKANHKVIQSADKEGAFECIVNAVNWENAVKQSKADGKQKIVNLTANWTASGSFTSGISTSEGYSNGRLYVPAKTDIVLNLKGFTLNRGLSGANNYGSVFYVAGTLVIDGNGNSNSIVRGGYANCYYGSARGGGIHIAGGGNVTLQNGATLRNNTVSGTYGGGGVYVASGGLFTLKSSYVHYNYSTNTYSGAGVYVAGGGKFVMESGSVYYNRASANYSAGGVFLADSGTLEMTGGQIGNYSSTGYANLSTTTTGAGGVYVSAGGILNVGGSANIRNNGVGSTIVYNTRDVYLLSNTAKINVISKHTSSSYKIGVYRSGNGLITSGYGKTGNTNSPSTYYVCENTTYTMLSEGSGETLEGSLLSGNNAENWSYAVQQSLNNKGALQTVTLTKNWTASGGSFGSGTGYASGRLYVPAGANITLNLNGYTVDRRLTSANNYGSVFYIAGTLTIQGTSSSYIKGGYANGYYSYTRGAGIHIYDNGTVNMEGGAIVSNRSTGSYGAGGVYVSSGATFNMKGGYIGASGLANTTNGSRSGAGVFVANGGKFCMSNEKTTSYIYCNTASGTYSAGGVYLDGNSTFEMKGGYIGYSSSAYNTATGNYSAGGVYSNGGTFTMTGGSFRNNRATGTYSAGGVYVNSGTFAMTAGYIGSSSTSYANYATNSAGNSVGGVYVNTNGKISLGGTAFICNNQTYNRYTGNLYFVNPNTSATVVSPFASGARINIYRTASVTTKPDGSAMTNGFGAQNGENVLSTNYFYADVTLATGAVDYRIIHENGEAYLYYLDPVTNWEIAVNTSSASDPKTVKLFANWKAGTNSNYTTAFSVNSNGSSYPFYQGTLNVPTGRSVILDLNGYTLSRELTAAKARANGYVLGVRGGTLKIIDSSAGKSGIIRGGSSNSKTVGSGIYVYSGTLTLEGGRIMENYGSYGVYVNSSSVLNLGGDIGVYNNKNTSNNPANIFLSLDSNLINIVSPLNEELKREIGITRTIPYEFTRGWGKYHDETVDPELHFSSDDLNFRIGPAGAGTATEVAILGNDNASNWQYAVTTSLKTKKTYTVQLVDDWSAGKNSSYGTAFGINTTAYYYGALYVPSGASIILDLNGFTVDRKLATGNVFNVVGKLEIVDLSAGKQGAIKGGSNGIYIYNGGTAVMNAGTVSGNANYGVHDYNGTFTMTGGTVTGNTGANVYVERNGRLNLGGKPVIDSEASGKNAVFAYESAVIGITSKFEEGAKVSILRKGVGQLTSGWSRYNSGEDPWKYLVSESDVFLPSTEEISGSLEAFLISYDNNINWQYAVSSSLSTGTVKTVQLYEDWTASAHETYTAAFGTTSAYLNGALYVPKGARVVLDLSGFDLNRNLSEARANGYIIYVQGELTVKDSRSAEEGEGARITGGKNNSGSSAGAVYVASGGVFSLSDAQIVDNEATSDSASAGAVYTAGTFNFTSGTISNNAGANAGGVYIAGSGAFNMADGTSIVGNASNGSLGGGAVYAAGAFGFKGGEISANTGTAGGVYVAGGGNLAFDGGKITSNNGTSAGGVYVYNSSSANFAMSGGEIVQNSVSGAKCAGGIYAGGGKTVISGGSVSLNRAEDGEDTAGGIYIAGAGNVTLTGGEISENTGANGVRADGSATLNLGGTAVVKDNASSAGKNIDIYMTNGARAINIVSKFESGAEIGIWRDQAGSFTKGYGIYNGAESGAVDPNGFFFSNKDIYSIFQTEAGEGESVEVAAGIPADRPYAIGADDESKIPVYNGSEQLVITGYDSTKMSIGDLPEGVKLTENGFTATHAGTYAVTFTPGSDYCWTNGTVSPYKVDGVIAPKPVALSWTNLEYTYDAVPHKPDASVTNLIGDDECTVTVVEEKTNAGTYTATASALSNTDYTLENGTDVTHEFVIHKAPMTLTFKTTTAVYKEALTLSLDGNVEGGTVTYTVENMTGKGEIQGTDTLMPTWVGEIKVTANVTETTNYLAGTVSETFTVEQAEAPLELAVKEASYGTPLTLTVTDYGEVGALTFTVEENKTGRGEIADGVFNPLSVGTVDIRITVQETHNYKETSTVNTITVKPRVVTLVWSDLEFVYDGNQHCATAEITNLVEGDECNLQVAGAQTNAGTYNATARSVDNNNYTLEGAEETVKEFVIHKANLSPVVNTAEIVFGKEEQIDIDGNLGSGSVKLTVLAGGTGRATASGDKLTGTWVGTVDVQAEIAETQNYLGAVLTFSIDVTPADPEVELATKEAVYGTDLKLTVSGNEENAVIHYSLTDGETKATISGDTLTPYAVGEVTVHIYAEPTHNYKEGNFTATVTVKPRPVTVIWTKLEFDYDGNEHVPEATITGLVEGDTCTVIVLGAQVNAGTHTAMADSLGNENYTLIGGTDVNTKFTIKPRAVTLSWDSPDFTYNGEMQTPTATVTNLIGEDECTVTVLGTKDAGTNLTAMATGLSNSNYTLDGGSNLVTAYAIKPLPVELEWTDTELVYNATEQKPTATVKNLCASDKCEVTVIGAQTNVGEYTATAFGVTNPNYTLDGGSNLSASFKIVRAPIDVKLVDSVLTYGTEATLAVEGNLGGGEVTFTVENGTGTATAKGSYILPTKVGTITVTATVAQTANYEGGSVTAEVAIQPRRVTLAWEEDMEFVYNGEEQAPSARVTDLLEGDTCDVRVSGHKDAGTNLTATASSLSNENYTLLGCTTLTATFTIVPLKAELTWSDFELVYNGKEQAPKAVVSNLIGTDKCEVTVAGETNVGNDLVASAINLSNPNYTLEGTTNLTATFAIKPLVADIVWSDTKLTYNAEEQAPTATVGNLCEGDSCLVTVSGAQINAGTYTATASALSNPNYTLTGATDLTSPFTIERAKREVSLVESETVYGTSLALTLAGNSENGSVSYQVSGGTGSATMSGSVLTPTRAGEVVLTVTVGETKNYEKTTATLTVTVKPKPVGLTWRDTEFTYDGTEKKPAATATGLIGSDSCEVIVGGGQTDAGAYLANASALSNSNYTLEGATDLSCPFVINKANITVTITSTRTTYGTPLPLVLEGNLGNAEVTYTVTEETGSGVVDGKGVFTATGFGTVTITAVVAESKNYFGATASARIVIDKGPAPIELATPEAVYGTPLVLVLSGADEEGKLTFAVQDGTGTATLSGNIMLPTKVGTVTLVVKMSATDTFVETIKTFTVTIKPRPVELAWEMTDFTYNGKEQAPKATVINLVDGDACEVTVSGQTDAGMDQVAAATAVSNENYTLEGSSTASTTYVIKPKTVTLDWGNTEFIYNGEDQAPAPTVTNLEGSDECKVTVTGAQTNAGDYFATASELSNPNYTLEGAENASCSFHIDRLKITVTITTTETVFGVNLKLETSGNLGGGEESFSVTDGTGSAEIAGDTLIPKRIGTVTVTVNVGETANTYGATAEAEITIKKGTVSVDFAKKSTVYGTPLKLELTGNEENGAYQYTITDETGSAELRGTDTLVPLKAGTVTVKVVVEETTNYDRTEFEAQITIEKLVAELEWAEGALVYNGKEQAPEVKIKNLVEGDACGVEVKGAKDAGKNLTATAESLSNENYTLEGAENLTCTFEITPLAVELEWGETSLEYNGEAQTPEITVLNLQGDDRAEDCTLTVTGAETAVGTGYTAKVEGVNNPNYTIEGADNLSTPFEITKGTFTIEIVAGEAIYNVPMKLSVTGNKSGGAVTYEVTEGPATLSGDMLTPTGTGETIIVKATVAETDNYFGAEAVVNLTAGKGKAEYALATSTVVYGTDLTLSVVDADGNSAEGEISYELAEGGTGSAELSGSILTPTRAGTVTLKITVGETERYVETSFTAQVTITPMTAEIAWEKTEFVYNGEGQVPSARVTNLLSADKDKVEVVVEGMQTDAGSYTASAVRLAGDNAVNYVLSESGNTTEFKIGKAEINPVITLSRVYCQIPAEITLEGNLGDAEVTFTIVEGGTGKAEISGKTITPAEEGSVIVKAVVAESKNYYGKTAQAVIVIEKKKIELGLAQTEVVYGNEITLVVTGNEENGTVKFTVVNDTGSATVSENGVLKGTGAGTVNIIISVAETGSYQATSETVKFTILPRQIGGLSWAVPELVYNGEAQAPSASASGILSGDECTVIVAGGKVNAGTYPAGTAYASALSNPNYTLGTVGGTNAPEFTIQKADPTITLTTQTATLGVPLTLEVSGNDGEGAVKYEIVTSAGGTGAAVINGDEFRGTKLGDVYVRVTVSATANYNEAYWNGTVTIEAPAIPLELTETETVYGDNLKLVAKEYEEGVVSFKLGEGGTGSAVIEGNTLIPKKAGTVTVILSVGASDSYQGATEEVTVTIKPRAVGVTWGDLSLPYNGTEQVASVTLSNVVEGDTCEVTVGGASRDAGKHTAVITMLGNDNYVLAEDAEKSKEFEITPRVVRLEWTVGDYTYNGKEQKPEVKILNLVAGDECEITVTGQKDASLTAKANATELSNKNYTLEGCENASVTFVIKQQTVSIEWGETELVYNGRPQTPVPILNGLVEGDECELTVTGAQKDVGSNYTATVEGVLNPNYVLESTSSVKYSIKPYELEITADDLVKEYNGEYQMPAITVTPLDENDDVVLTLEGLGEYGVYEVGKYDITLTLSGTAKGNYAIKEGQETLTFEITPMEIPVLITPKDVTVIYEGAPITADDIEGWYVLELQGALAPADAELTPDELFKGLVVKPIIKSGDNIFTEITENGIYLLTPDISDEAVVCGNYSLKLIINPDDEYCDLIVNGESTDVITLRDESEYQFLTKTEENGGIYRFTYAEMGWTHGEHDVDKVDKYVIGQISPSTSVNAFLNNIKNNKSVRVYSKEGKLLYDCGTPGEGITADDLGRWMRIRVTTGSYVTLVKDGKEVDRVYLSVLGDVNGDGLVNSSDVSAIARHIQNQVLITNTECVLAAMIANNGQISTADMSRLNLVIMSKATMSDYFYKPNKEEIEV